MRADPKSVLWYLDTYHRGHERTCSAKKLASHFHLTDTRRVREAISELRSQRHPILATHEGYYIPTSREDAQPGIRFLTQMFKPLRDSYEGAVAGVDEKFGAQMTLDERGAA